MRLGRNILWNLAAFFWLSLLIIFVTPYMVRHLGLEAFGLWAIITAFSGYLTAMDLGLGNALIRFLAAENERGDRRELERYLRSGVSLQAGLGALGALALFVGSETIAHRWIRVPPADMSTVVASFRISSLTIFLGFLAVTYGAVAAALHRFDLLALRTILMFTVQYLLIVGVLHLGGGLQEVVAVYVLGSGAIVVYLLIVSRRLLPDVNLLPGWDPDAVKELLRFGRMKFPAQLSVTLLQQFDRVALGSLLPVAMVSFYAVPLRISQRLGQVAENVAGPFYPAVTSHLAAERIETLRRQYRQGTRMVMGAVCGAIAVLGGLAGPLLGVWMGVDFASHGTWPFRLLLLAYGASALFTLPSVAADAAGRPGIPAAFMVVGSLVHVAFIWLAVPHFGLSGAAGGVLLGFLLPLLSGVPTMHLRIAALPPLRSLFSEVRSAVLAGAISGLAAWAMSHAAYPSSGPLALIISLAVCSLLYLGLVFLLGGLRVEELRRAVLLLRSVPKVNTD